MSATATLPSAEPAAGAPEPESRRPRWRRHPADVARLVASLAVFGVLLLVSATTPGTLRNISADVVALADNIPTPVSSALVGFVQLLALVAPVVVVAGLLARRRLDLLALLGLTALVAGLVMVLATAAARDAVPVEDVGITRVDAWFIGRRFPSSTYLAGAVALLVAASPFLRRSWRRAGWVFVGGVLVVQVLTATEVPIHLAMVLAIGGLAGSATLVIFGAPPRRVDPATIVDALASAGVRVDAVVPITVHRGVPTFRVTLADGEAAFVKVVGRDERDTDLLLRSLRSLAVKGLGDESPGGVPHRIVEHEALSLAVAAAAGVPVPSPVAVARTEEDAAVLATSWVDGVPLADLAAEQVTDELLQRVWAQVASLQRRRVAHRSLRPSNILVRDGEPVLVDFRRADVTATDMVLGADVAELLASLAVLVGPERAVAGAAAALGADELARAVPLLQPAVLSRDTRAAAKADKALLPDLRDRAAAAAGVERVEVAPVKRITLKGTVSLVGSVVLAAYLLNLVANWRDIWNAFTEANLAYLPPMLLMAAVPYFSGALSLLGSVNVDLAFLRSTEIMFAQSFLNRFTPANAGGMALRMRYLQLNGVDTTVAAAAVGLTSAASGAVQAVLIVVFFVWGGTTDRFSDIEMPDISTVLLVVIGAGAMVGAVVLSGWGRRVVVPWFRRTWRKVVGSFGELARQPAKMAQLFGGAAIGKLANIIAFWLSVQAFGVEMSFAKAGALYMVANTVGSAVPTPGGVGGIEAALTAVLLSFGVDNATAAAIVLLFRLITFWLPTLPGWFFLQSVQRRGIV